MAMPTHCQDGTPWMILTLVRVRSVARGNLLMNRISRTPVRRKEEHLLCVKTSIKTSTKMTVTWMKFMICPFHEYASLVPVWPSTDMNKSILFNTNQCIPQRTPAVQYAKCTVNNTVSKPRITTKELPSKVSIYPHITHILCTDTSADTKMKLPRSKKQS